MRTHLGVIPVDLVMLWLIHDRLLMTAFGGGVATLTREWGSWREPIMLGVEG